jgi:hypothetical protein
LPPPFWGPRALWCWAGRRGGGNAHLGGDLPADPPCRQVYPRGGLIPMLEKIPYTDGPPC